MTKTIQELYQEVTGSEELKAEFIVAAKDGKALDFIKSHGVDATEDEIRKAFSEGFIKDDEELSPEEIDNAAGGACSTETGMETVASVFSVGIMCAGAAIYSAVGEHRHVGQKGPGDGRLCNDDQHGSITRKEGWQ